MPRKTGSHFGLKRHVLLCPGSCRSNIVRASCSRAHLMTTRWSKEWHIWNLRLDIKDMICTVPITSLWLRTTQSSCYKTQAKLIATRSASLCEVVSLITAQPANAQADLRTCTCHASSHFMEVLRTALATPFCGIATIRLDRKISWLAWSG